MARSPDILSYSTKYPVARGDVNRDYYVRGALIAHKGGGG